MPSPTSARSRPPQADRKLTTTQALVLGALQGPAELLPISSSAHIGTASVLLGWRYGELEPELRKAFEVALHAGTALALLISLRAPILDRRTALVVGPASAPPALAGYALEGEIERRLARDASRPIIFYTRVATCWRPRVKGLNLVVNSVFNSWRFEDVWLDR